MSRTGPYLYTGSAVAINRETQRCIWVSLLIAPPSPLTNIRLCSSTRKTGSFGHIKLVKSSRTKKDYVIIIT